MGNEEVNTLPKGLSADRAIERLTALWALAEAGMGGLIHAMKIPFTGIVVGSAAVILISTIGFFAERRASAIFRATMIVVLVKAAASPHTPLPAYLAVMFQGLVGAALFGILPWPRVAALLLSVLAFWEGAVQKLLVMTLLYGKPFWEAIDLVGHRVLQPFGAVAPGTPTKWFLLIYGAYYTLGGLLTGWLAATLPFEVARAAQEITPDPQDVREVLPPGVHGMPKPWWRRFPVKAAIAAFVLTLLLVVVSPSGAGLERGVRMFLRAAIALALWFLVVRPLGTAAFSWFKRREQSRYAADMTKVMNLMPSLRRSVAAAWARTASLSGWTRWKSFLVDVTARALAE